ncbi:MAG: riboflavin synthase subunit alpha [Desulfobulbaceae bacterium BRH_c16a]|nr:MAG: riboflavin synthase subunit alpha [Desulfobulbaceae bacterium BRH_c16a]
MFTGIIEGMGKIVGRRTGGGGIILDLHAGFELTDPEEGESIAINGVCLTAYNISGRRFCADVSPETLSRTKLGALGPGEQVNLERALKLSDRLGGHLVSGHVDCMATVSSRKETGQYTLFSFSVPGEVERYIIEKGSIAIDGVSLTVNSCGSGSFAVSIIPHTLKVTTLGALKVGSKVNIEVDLIGKYVEKLLSPRTQSESQDRGEGIDPGFLARNGFM